MNGMPARPPIYHITHLRNLALILADGGLLSDASIIARGGPPTSIGMDTIKERRLGLPVRCHPGDFVGDYVPFYFCPRSIMLYIIHQANHPNLAYRDGQGPILHLEADLFDTIAWADAEGRRWAFTLSNAGAYYTEFRNRPEQLDEVDWAAVASNDFRDPQVKEGKQAEFLVYGLFPWHLVRRIGVRSLSVRNSVLAKLRGAAHQPVVDILPGWYF